MTRHGLEGKIAALSMFAVIGCRGYTENPNTGPVAVEPSAVTLPQGGVQGFIAVTAATGTSITWSIAEGATGGSITTAGMYTAPMSAGTFHVVATSVADTTKSASATVTVQLPPVAIAINPTTASVSGCNTARFAATVTNTSNTAVSWSVQEGTAGGTVDATGLYTAPSSPGTYHVVATSQADPTKTAIAAVTVSTQVLAVAVSPGAPTVQTGGTVTFTATVTTTCGQFTATQAIAQGG
jgi:hypothetical protein